MCERAHEALESLAEDLRWRQQADDDERLERELEKIAGLHEQVV
jgi:hypothetical protein